MPATCSVCVLINKKVSFYSETRYVVFKLFPFARLSNSVYVIPRILAEIPIDVLKQIPSICG
jgi:hypothetical protein